MRKVLVLFFLGLVLLSHPALAQVSIMTAVSAHAQQEGNPNIKVWVDTAYGIYHCPGSKWYGRTRYGLLMTQRQAQERGYRPAYGWVCR